jgi:hypothetical protein
LKMYLNVCSSLSILWFCSLSLQLYFHRFLRSVPFNFIINITLLYNFYLINRCEVFDEYVNYNVTLHLAFFSEKRSITCHCDGSV